MRLVDLEPRWLTKDGVRVGFVFRCPLDPANAHRLQSVMFAPTPRREQWALWEENGFEADERCMIQGCNPNARWTCTPSPELADFGSLSVDPSVDGSAGGNWHGHITKGEIVGGGV